MRAPVVVAAAALLLTGCGEGDVTQRQLNLDSVEPVAVSSIVLQAGAGKVVVRTGDVQQTEIRRTVRYRGDEPDAGYRIHGTELVLETGCGPFCSISYEITAPRNVAVRGRNDTGDVELTQVGPVDLRVGSGAVRIDGAAGQVTAETGSGALTVQQVEGSVALRTGSGAVTGRELAGDVDAETGSGAIGLTLRTVSSVNARTGSGAVRLEVPAGDYQIRVETNSGRRQIDVPDVPAAAHTLQVRTAGGDVTIGRR